MRNLVVGTRGSRLALSQTRWVADQLRTLGVEPDTRIIQTEGDKSQAANTPLSSFGEKGIFAHELESALHRHEIDIAVHSMKDLAHTLPEGLIIGAVPQREDYRDCLIGSTLEALPEGARVGTGSIRRRALLLSRRPDLRFIEVRGNIDTRLRKLDEGLCDALCLAAAGLKRLGLQDRITEFLDPDWFTPDPGQGAIGVQLRDTEEDLKNLLHLIGHTPTWRAVTAERSFLKIIGGSCKSPVGAIGIAHAETSSVSLTAMVASPDGRIIHRASASGSSDGDLAEMIMKHLRAAGADSLFQAGIA